MATQSPPVLSIQPPKDVSLGEIEAELRQIWQSYGENGDSPSAIRATTFSLVVYEPEETQQLLAALGYYSGPIDGILGPRMVAALKAAQKAYGLERTGRADEATKAKLREEYNESVQKGQTQKKLEYSGDLEGFGIADAIAASNPCRIIALCPIAEEDEGVKAQVSASCPIQKQSQSTLICCEYITLTGTAAALERISGVISELMLPELPKFLWWKGTPDPNYGLFQRLAGLSNTVIVDSSSFSNPEEQLSQMCELINQGTPVADLNWGRLAPWQELTAEAFDPPERRGAIYEVDQVTIDYEKGNEAQALMFLSWLASRLEWLPTSDIKEGGDYDLRRVKFIRPNQQPVEAELAAIPVADVGDVAGDLISLRLGSTNLQADCCTVLCSQTTGCMRMEAGGGAQSCRIQQVSPLFDQKTEFLLSQQLQRWGREMLYEESMAVTKEILKLTVTS
ncbi:MAG: glucose-6-phosphate dehydrogenase assembly protein OpcA [Moorea sp. SIO2I5]|nr:glucose-6-phosphate dehydrogenase assembly protein OpcA [Moorena sp. SIO2I5]